jgi:RimJ/RimL family protein N-acetyltransferase
MQCRLLGAYLISWKRSCRARRRLAAHFAFEQIGLIRAEIVIAAGNQASIRVAEKIGTHYERILLNRMVVGKSIYDAHMYPLLPADFGLVARL